MLFLIGAIALAVVALGTSWGTIGTVVILITATAWMTLAFRPVEAGALVTNRPRRRFVSPRRCPARWGARPAGRAFVVAGHR